MNEIKVFNNEKLGVTVRTLKNEDGSISISAIDTAIGFGWTKTESKDGKGYISIRWERMNAFSKEIGFDHKWSKDDYIPESLFYRLGMKANNETANKFQNWLAMEVIPSIRKTGSYSKQPNISPQLQLMQGILDQLVNQEAGIKKANETSQKALDTVENIKEVVAMNSVNWRKDTTAIINKIALKLGGYENIRNIREESYKALEQRISVSLNTRMTNIKKNLALNGVCKSKIDKINQLDAIDKDKKLIEAYVAIVKELAIKYGVDVRKGKKEATY